jgi:hypothetical protein
MPRRDALRHVCSTILLLSYCQLAPTPPVFAQDDAHDAAVQRALKLLPKRPERIVLLDYHKASPAMREKLSQVEGFVTDGPTVYLKKQGFALERASKGPGFFDYIVAINIWHEMAHIAGADEPEARRQEEELWKEFIVSKKVDTGRGLVYLDLLRKRPPPESGRAAASAGHHPASSPK